MDVKITNGLNEAAVEGDLLLCLAQRRSKRACITGLNLAAWERNLPCVVHELCGALGEQHRQLWSLNDRDQHSGGSEWPHRGDCSQHCRVSVVVIMARDSVWIGEPFRHVE